LLQLTNRYIRKSDENDRQAQYEFCSIPEAALTCHISTMTSKLYESLDNTEQYFG